MVTGAFKNKGKFSMNQEKTRWMVLDELKYNEIKKQYDISKCETNK